MVSDSDFDDLVAGLTFDEDRDLPSDVTSLGALALVRRNEVVRQALLAMGELTSKNPTTQEARDLHSERVALLVEMTRRNLR